MGEGKNTERKRKPRWLRRPLGGGGKAMEVQGLLRGLGLATVCQSARCPNRGECFQAGTATFLILGEVCTRNCRFCAIPGGAPAPPDPREPERVAEAARRLGLRHVVVTSVTRDDLPDGGAGAFAATIRAVRETTGARVEVLTPDFQGRRESLAQVLAAQPAVFNHNLETVPRLYPVARPQADYRRSLAVLAQARELAPGVVIKSGLMLGLGEREAEVEEVIRDLVAVGCQILVLGQYLQPSPAHLPVAEYFPPERFEAWRKRGLALGLQAVVAAPLARSSYHAKQIFQGEGKEKGKGWRI